MTTRHPKALIKNNQTYAKGEIKPKIVSCVSQSNQTCPSVMSLNLG